MNEVVHTSPTIGSNVEEVRNTHLSTTYLPLSLCVQVRWRNLHFVMWDIGGQESLRQAWSTYYSSTHFLILVVDSTDRERLAVTRGELHQMLEHEVTLQ